MILDQTAHTLQRGSLTGERQFGIALSPKIYSMMSDKLYTDRIGSAVREVCSNAWDGMKMKSLATGQPIEPFSVTLPTDLEPHFIVEDFGVGMPDEAAQDLYSTLGLSTKENSNDQIGAFGLGSKSPFAVTDTFTVENTYDGITHYYLCFKSETGLPSLLKTGQKTEDRPNGVKVIIPSSGSNYSAYKKALQRQLVAMEPKPIIKNIEEFIFVDAQVVAENEFGYVLSNASSFGLKGKSMYARMGMVLYPVDDAQVGYSYSDPSLHKSLNDNSALVLNFPIGAIEPLPSREALTYDKRTINNIKSQVAKFKEVYRKLLKDEVMKQPTPLDAYNKIISINASTGINMMNDQVYINGWPVNAQHQPNVFPTFNHDYIFTPIPLIDPQGALLPNQPLPENRSATRSQFFYETFDYSDLRLNTKRNQNTLDGVKYDFMNRIMSGDYRIMAMDELEPKHRISRMKSVLNGMNRHHTTLVVRIDHLYPGSKVDFTDFLKCMEAFHPGSSARVQFFSKVEKPDNVRTKRTKDEDAPIDGLSFVFPDVDEEKYVHPSAIAALTGEEEDDDYWVNYLKKYPFTGKACYIRATRNELTDYPTYKMERFKALATKAGLYLVIVRKGGLNKIEMLEENGIVEFSAMINAELDGATTTDDYKKKSSCITLTINRKSWFGHFPARVIHRLYRHLRKEKQYIHPLFTLRQEIVEIVERPLPNNSITKLISMLKSEGFIPLFKNATWANEVEIDMETEFNTVEEQFNEYYPALRKLLDADNGGYGNEDYCPMKYQYILDYNALRNIQAQQHTVVQTAVPTNP